MKQTTHFIIGYYWKKAWDHPWLSSVVLISNLSGILALLVFPFLLKDLINVMTGEPLSLPFWQNPISIVFIILIVDVIQWIAWRISHYGVAELETRVIDEIQIDCFRRLHAHSYNFFNSQFVGSLVKRVNRFTRSFEEITDRMVFEVMQIAVRLVIVIGVLFFVRGILGFALLVWSAIFIALNYVVALYKLKKYDLPRSQADTKVTGYLADTITNNINLKLFATLQYELRKFKAVSRHWLKANLASWRFDAHILVVQGALMVVLNFFVLYTAVRLWQRDLISVGHFVLLQTYLIDLFRNLWDFGRTVRGIYDRLADAEEMAEIILRPIEVVDQKPAKSLVMTRGKVEFRNVSFSYDGEQGVLQDLSFSVKPGETVALIGPSGGGKSTVVKLLLRLFDVSKGSILIDNQKINRVSQDSLRSNIALVPQDPILFHRTLRENIRYGRLTAKDVEILAAAKLARCDEFIERFPNGYDTYVGERGVKLSGGQRQRIAIARAILANTRLLVLDEATSSLDSESEKLIQEALHSLLRNKTTFIIAHRLSTIMNADRILVLEQGKIIEEGSHAILMQTSGSVYRKLWELQVGGYLSV